MNYVGDFPEDQTVYIEFNTFTSDDPSASATITDLVDADIKVHKDGNVTEIVTDGATIAINFDGVTGNHLITIDTSIDAAYSTGSDYLVRIEGTTVDGAVINAWVGSFSIENRFMRGTDSALLAASVNIADGAIKSDLTHIHGTALSETAGQLAAAFKKLFDVATPLLVASDVMVGTDGANTTTPPTVSEIQTEMEQDGASVLDIIRDELANGTDGLSALKTLIDAIPTTMVGTDNAALASVLGAAVGATISADIADIPTVAEFNARSIVSADYTIVSDLGTVQSGDSFARIGVAGAGLSDITVNAASVTAIWAKAMTDLAQGAPSATASALVALNYIYMAWRNKTTTTATLITVMKDDGSTGLVKSTISDDSTTFTKGEFITGA